jgi:phage baseplate assembly protein W
MKSLLLSQASNDLAFDQLKRLRMVDGQDEDVQAVWLELSTGQGEWFLNLMHGVPWWQLLDTQASQERIRAEVLVAIYRTERVSKVTSLDITVNRATRVATINWEGIFADGTTTQQTAKVVI